MSRLLTPLELKAIRGLITLARAAWNAVDNGEEIPARSLPNGIDSDNIFPECDSVLIDVAYAEPLSDALNELDKLPDDRPGYTMEAAARAEWALRRLLPPE